MWFSKHYSKQKNIWWDFIAFGLPFSDPMADGPVIQRANELALKSEITTKKSLELINKLSKNKQSTSFVIMCYLNTIRKFGVNKFIKNIKNIVDGLIIVDLPFEEESEIKNLLTESNIYLIKLISPMTDQKRAKKILKNSKGFIYYISSTGITGSNKLNHNEINKNVKSLKKISETPILVGFGVKARKDVISISKQTSADGVIIGSALIQKYFDLKMDFNKYLKSLKKFIQEVKV